MSENYIKKTYFGERGVANIILSSNINGEFSICLKDKQNGVKSSWEMIMCEEDAKKIALNLAKITGIISLDATVNNAPTVEEDKIIKCHSMESKSYIDGFKKGYEAGKQERPQGEIKKYKPLEPDYNVQCAVENLRAAYWSNEPEKVAKDFTEAEDIISSAICHQGYTVCKQSQSDWVPVSERLPEEKIDPITNDFELVLCSTFLGTVRVCKYGKPMGYSKAHFWDWGEIMDEYVKAWQPLPEPYVDARGQEHD